MGSFSISAEGDFGVTQVSCNYVKIRLRERRKLTMQLDYPNEKEVIERFESDDMVRFSYVFLLPPVQASCSKCRKPVAPSICNCHARRSRDR